MNVLVAPLDWGLGHATRCIPIIRLLIERGCNVMIGGSGPSLELLKRTFPALESHTLPAYNPEYSASDRMMLTLGRQLPKFLKTIRHEHEVVERIIQAKAIRWVISDNRYGCWSKHAKSTLVCHQLSPRPPDGLRWLRGLTDYLHATFVRRFSSVWIPDVAGAGNLSGELSENKHVQGSFVGCLSRFQSPCVDQRATHDVLFLLSGPEPQRTLFESRIMAEVARYPVQGLMVRGVPSASSRQVVQGDLTKLDFAEPEALRDYICSARLVICRPGYSTLMDMMALGKRVFLVPTPGQTEQIYLAERLEHQRVSAYATQDDLDLADAIKKSDDCVGFAGWNQENLLGAVIDKQLKVFSSV